MPTAYSYMRFSTSEQAKGDSKRRQTQLAAEYAKANGLELDDKLTYRDFGVSAYRGANVAIGKLGEFMEAIRKKEVKPGSFLLVESLDRLSRDHILPAQNIFTQIILEGVSIVTLADNRVYSADLVNKSPFLLIEAIVILIRANEESERKSQRLKAMWQNKRDNIESKRLTPLGPAWLKYNKTKKAFEVIPERGAIILRIFTEYLEGKGFEHIAQSLMKDKVPTWSYWRKHSNFWHKSYIRTIITGTTTIGTLTLHTVDRHNCSKRIYISEVEGYYPCVIPESIYIKAQELRKDKRINPKATNIRWTGIFDEIGKCTICGSNLVNASIKPNFRYWKYMVCLNATNGEGCNHRPALYSRLEYSFLKEFKKALSVFPFTNIDSIRPNLLLVEHKQKLDYFEARRKTLLESGSEVVIYSQDGNRYTNIDFLDASIFKLKNDLSKILSKPKYFKIQQMYDHIAEFKLLTINCKEVDRDKIMNVLSLMCDEVHINKGRVEVKFKLGPKLIIEYKRKWSKFTYDSDCAGY